MNKYDQPVNNSYFGGTALSIAYTSNVDELKPSEMTVISANYTSVWYRELSFEIPKDLPSCGDEGCLCTWNWIHQVGHLPPVDLLT